MTDLQLIIIGTGAAGLAILGLIFWMARRFSPPTPPPPDTRPPDLSTGVAVRRYRNAAAFQADASAMATAGWTVAAQSEETGGVSGNWMALAVLAAVGGLVVHYLLLVLAVIAVIVSVASRTRLLVVTYRSSGGQA